MAWRVRTDQDRAQSGTLRSQRRAWLALARRGASFLGGQLRAHWLLVVGLLAFGALVVAVAPARLARVLSEVDARLLGLMLPCLLGHYVLRALAWRVALRRLGVPLRVTRAVLLTLAGQALIFLPGGDLWRVPVLARMGPGGHDEGELASTVAFDDLVLLVLLTLALLPAVFQVPNLVFAVVWVLLGEAAAITLLSWPRAYAAAVGAAARVPPMRRFDAQPRHLGPAFWRIVSVRTLAASTLLNAGAAMLSFAASSSPCGPSTCPR